MFTTAGPAFSRLHPQKGLTICIYQAFKAGKESFFGKFGVITDLGILDSKNELQTILYIGVQGDCEYIYEYTPSIGKLFLRRVICYYTFDFCTKALYL